jgi:protein-disulfide isomerase
MFKEDKPGCLTLSPKASFILGLVGGVLVLCTIGFFILLGLVIKGQVGASPSEAVPSAAAPSAAVPSAAAPDENVVGEVAAVTKDDHVTGAKDAVVTLVEYSDFECPYCGRFQPVMEQLMADPAYQGKIRWVYRHFPLSFHANAVPAAHASECASEQGKFWEMASKLYANQSALTEANFKAWAKELGLKEAKFAECYSASKYQTRIDADRESGTIAGISGTPATVILGKNGSKTLIPGALPIDQVKAMVDAALK